MSIAVRVKYTKIQFPKFTADNQHFASINLLFPWIVRQFIFRVDNYGGFTTLYAA